MREIFNFMFYVKGRNWNDFTNNLNFCEKISVQNMNYEFFIWLLGLVIFYVRINYILINSNARTFKNLLDNMARIYI